MFPQLLLNFFLTFLADILNHFFKQIADVAWRVIERACIAEVLRGLQPACLGTIDFSQPVQYVFVGWIRD